MSGNSFGSIFKITTFGESHGPALGTVIDGCPAGVPLDEPVIQRELDRRRPGVSAGAEAGGKKLSAAVTSRKENDACEILSGVFGGYTTGTSIAVLIRNTSQRSQDYGRIADVFRPGHADYTYHTKYGRRDYRGGGRSSGRETAARVASGAVAKQLLGMCGIHVAAFTLRAAGIQCEKTDLSVTEQNPLRAADCEAAARMEERLAELRRAGDSAGGSVECRIQGVPAGWGEPVFDKLDAELAKAVMSIGAVKGVEFGAGFSSADMTGSQWNDSMKSKAAENPDLSAVRFESNNAGGVLGGISSGQDIVFRAAVKPVPSILRTQHTVNTRGGNEDILIEGRHDVCLCPRIVPVIEAMTAAVLADMYLRQRAARV